MTITRERQPYYPGQETGGSGDARICQQSDKRIWYFY